MRKKIQAVLFTVLLFLAFGQNSQCAYFREDFETYSPDCVKLSDGSWGAGALGHGGDAGIVETAEMAGNRTPKALFSLGGTTDRGAHRYLTTSVPEGTDSYTISFDLMVPGEWDLSHGAYYELYFGNGGTPMIVLTCLGDADRLDARSLSAGGGYATVWTGIYNDDRPKGFVHYDIIVQPGTTQGVLSVYRDGALAGQMTDLGDNVQALSQYIQWVSFAETPGTGEVPWPLVLDNLFITRTDGAATFLDENFDEYGQVLSDDSLGRWQAGSLGNSGDAGFIAFSTLDANATPKACFSAMECSNQSASMTFPNSLPQDQTDYKICFDLMVDGEWSTSTASRYEIGLGYDGTYMMVLNCLGNADRFDARSATNSGGYSTVWAQTYNADRAEGFLHYEIEVYPGASQAMAVVLRDGVELGRLTDLTDTISAASQYMNWLAVNVIAGDATVNNALLIDNVSVTTLDGQTAYLKESFDRYAIKVSADANDHWAAASLGHVGDAGFVTTALVGDNVTAKGVFSLNDGDNGVSSIFPLAVSETTSPYTISFDLMVDAEWSIADGGHYEIYFGYDATTMMCFNCLGDADRLDVRRESISGNFGQLWVDIHNNDRPQGFVHYDITVFPGTSQAAVNFYRDGQLVASIDDLSDHVSADSQYMNWISIAEIPGTVAVSPKMYIDNIAVAYGQKDKPTGYFSPWTKPSTVYRTNYTLESRTMEERFVAIAVAGVVANQTQSPQILLSLAGNADYWQDEFVTMAPSVGINVQTVSWLPWDLVSQFSSYIDGYVIYSNTDQIGISKGLNRAGQLNAIPITSAMVATAQSLGLTQLDDVSVKTEKQIFDEDPSYWKGILIGGADTWTGQWWHTGNYDAIARRHYIVNLDSNGWTTDRLAILNAIPANEPCWGWTIKIDEDQLVTPLSERGIGILGPGSLNTPIMELLCAGEAFPYSHLQAQHRKLSDLTWEDDGHYATMYMSDEGQWYYQWVGWPFGTQTEWLTSGRDDDNRGFGINWGRCMGATVQLFPSIYRYLGQSACNQDYFVSDTTSAGGYYYPEYLTNDLPTWILRDSQMLSIAGHNSGLVMSHSTSSTNNIADYPNEYIKYLPPQIGEIFYHYAPHDKFSGQLTWQPNDMGDDEVPISGMDYVVWLGNMTPLECAAALSGKTTTDPVDDISDYSFVFVHAWSNFGTEGQQYTAARTIYNNTTNSDVRFVTLEEYFLQMRLHLKPAETLKAWNASLQRKLDELLLIVDESAQVFVDLGEISCYLKGARACSARSDWSGSFGSNKLAAQMLESVRLGMLVVELSDSDVTLALPSPVDNPYSIDPWQYPWLKTSDDLAFKLQDLYGLESIQLQEDNDSDFSSPSRDVLLDSDAFTLSNSNINWRVRAVAADGTTGGWTIGNNDSHSACEITFFEQE